MFCEEPLLAARVMEMAIFRYIPGHKIRSIDNCYVGRANARPDAFAPNAKNACFFYRTR